MLLMNFKFGEVDILGVGVLGVNILGVDIFGVDILGVDILRLTLACDTITGLDKWTGLVD